MSVEKLAVSEDVTRFEPREYFTSGDEGHSAKASTNWMTRFAYATAWWSTSRLATPVRTTRARKGSGST